MTKITSEQAIIEAQKGAGIICFVGGFSSKNGKEVLIVRGEHWLCDENDYDTPEHWTLIEQQNQEAQEFADKYTSRGEKP